MMRHILSTVKAHWPLHAATEATGISWSLYATTTISVTSDAASCPRPCIAKTAAMIPPRYLVLANSAVMTALNGSRVTSVRFLEREIGRDSLWISNEPDVLTVASNPNAHHHSIKYQDPDN